MTVGSLLAMPLLVINLGGEMIYILQQRLQAQNVAKSRARKVLQDVLRTMYSKTFVGELFKPQEMYSNSSTRQIFNKLAHSSIMRINEASMEKLYDLMTMGVKYQLLCCNAPTQIMQVTLNHLYAMKQISTDSDVDELITNVFNLVKSAYCSLRNGDWELLKQQLFQFFQGRKVKVSLFLQANLQHMNGTLVLLHSGPVAYGSEVPGDITYYDSNGEFSKKVEFEALHGSGSCEPACSTFFDPKFYLGLNIYLNDKKEMKEELEKYWEEDDYVRDVSEMMMDAKDGQLKSGDFSASPKARTKKDTSSSVAQSKSVDSLGCDDEVRRKRSVSRPRRGSVNELNMLASLMGAAVEKTENENEDNGGESKDEYKPIKMNFDSYFGNFGGGTSVGSNEDGEENLVATQKIDGTKTRLSMDDRLAQLGLGLEMAEAKNDDDGDDDGGEKGGDDEDDEDDLLDLLDEAK